MTVRYKTLADIEHRAHDFWARVARGKPNRCWLWTAICIRGYGCFHHQGGRIRAHRAAWILTWGDVPDGLYVLHACDEPACCNPRHLMLGSILANVTDRERKGRSAPPPKKWLEAVRPKGARHGRAKLTEAEASAILADTRNLKLVAADYGVSERTIWSIRKRETWLHLPASL